MKKIVLLCVIATAFTVPCFAQNMLLLGGEYNLTNPQFWSAGLGFNLKLFNEYIQNDLTLNFGNIRAKEMVIKKTEPQETEPDDPETGDPAQNVFSANAGSIWAHETKTAVPVKFLFYVKDTIYFSLDGKWVGIRAGVFASMGIYDIPDYKTAADLFFNGGGFAGIYFLPRSLIGVTVDVAPGYAIAFRVGETLGINEAGFSLPLSVCIRLNLDKW